MSYINSRQMAQDKIFANSMTCFSLSYIEAASKKVEAAYHITVGRWRRRVRVDTSMAGVLRGTPNACPGNVFVTLSRASIGKI